MSNQKKYSPGAPASFDEAAGSYDVVFSQSPVGKLQRERVHHLLSACVSSSPLDILEINGGTGNDAIWLAEKGHHIAVTDGSSGMIEVLKGKLKDLSGTAGVQASQVLFKDLRYEFPQATFDMVFSDFGGLNCISREELIVLADDVAGLLRPGGRFVGVIMGKNCLWESFYFLLKGKFREAFRRRSDHPLPVKIGNSIQQTWYYSPQGIRKIFSDRFRVVQVRPVGIAIPPSYLNPFFSRRSIALALLSRLESMLSFSFLSNYADHYFIVLQKIK